MHVARIGIVALAFTASSLAAQQLNLPTLQIRVQDASGAVIPGAEIQFSSLFGAKDQNVLDTRTNQAGEATVVLDSGSYRMSVESAGFETWSGPVRITSPERQSIQVQLKIGRTGGIEVTPAEVMEIEHSVPEESIVEIPLEPLALPARKHHLAHTHRWSL